jgi:transcriptional regulator with XRE-family HTH domain
MKKPIQPSPRWVVNLRALMTALHLNPRSLSLKAGLNATAVRDMLEGRTRFPRYDTVLALAKALDVTASELMGGEAAHAANAHQNKHFDDDLELLTEIISRLQEVIDEYNHALGPRDFAAMVASLYRRMKLPGAETPSPAELQPRIVDLLEYEALRQKTRS